MQRAIDILAIHVPKAFSGGTYISDFSVTETAYVPEPHSEECTKVPRLYANKRGRKSVKRDDEDLLAAFLDGKDLIQHLQEHHLLEEVPC